MDIQDICDHFCRYILKKNLLCISNTRKHSDDYSCVVINQQFFFNCSYYNKKIYNDQYINDVNRLLWNFTNDFISNCLNNSLKSIYGNEELSITINDYPNYFKIFVLHFNKSFKLF